MGHPVLHSTHLLTATRGGRGLDAGEALGLVQEAAERLVQS